jgi:hypothetical protein
MNGLAGIRLRLAEYSGWFFQQHFPRIENKKNLKETDRVLNTIRKLCAAVAQTGRRFVAQPTAPVT